MQYLVQSLALVGIYGILFTVAVGGTLFVIAKTFKGRALAFAAILTFICLLAGYSIGNAVFLAQAEMRDLPTIVRTDGGDGHTAILYFTHGEPPGYDPMPWILTIGELDHDNVPFVPWFFRPMFFNTLRNAYLEAGGSPHNVLHYSFIDSLRRTMPEAEANGTRFYLAFLDSAPHPDEVAIQAINDGASKIIILPIFITESTHTIAGRDMVASVDPEQYGVEICYTGALGDSDSLQQVFVERANEMSSDLNKSKVGILLVGHGQPTEWENLYPEQNRQETQYRDGIRNKLIADGFLPDNILFGWMSFQEPSITASAQALAENNVEKILVFSVSLSAEAIHSLVDVPMDIEAAELPAEITIEYVGQYGDHPLAIQAMIEKIMPCF
jgi:sirohydrochlorin ferrochelatase